MASFWTGTYFMIIYLIISFAAYLILSFIKTASSLSLSWLWNKRPSSFDSTAVYVCAESPISLITFYIIFSSLLSEAKSLPHF